jgi:hypothetical protein
MNLYKTKTNLLPNKAAGDFVYKFVSLIVRLVRNNIQYSNRVFIQKLIPGSKLNKIHGSLE